MPTVPQTKSTWVDDTDALSSTNLHAYLRDPIQFLMSKPAAMLRSTSSQSPTSGNWAVINFQAETLDTDPDGVGGHSTSSNTSRYTARYSGWYRISGGVTFAGNSTGRRGARWTINGSVINSGQNIQAAGSSSSVSVMAPSPLVYLAEGDYLELWAYQDSGGGLATSTNAESQCWMSVSWDRLT